MYKSVHFTTRSRVRVLFGDTKKDRVKAILEGYIKNKGFSVFKKKLGHSVPMPKKNIFYTMYFEQIYKMNKI